MRKCNLANIKQTVFILFILFIAFLFRFINLSGDAPAGDISRSGVFYVDEGTYAHNVINKALFEQWFLDDDYNAMSNVPIFSLFQYGVVKIFGIGLVQIRYGGVIYSLLSLVLLWIILKSVNASTTMIALCLGAINYFYIIYNRLALLENLLVLFLVIISGFLFLFHKKQRSIWLVLATIFFFAGYFIKATIVFFLPVILTTIFLTHSSWKTRVRSLFVFLITLALLILGVVYFWILPNKEDWIYFQQLNISLKFPGSPVQVLFNYARYFGNLKLFAFMPVMYTLFLFYIGYLFSQLYKREKLSFAEIFFLTWAISGVLFLGFFAYSPPRFSLILMPAVISLVAIFLSKIGKERITFDSKLSFLILGFVAVICCSQAVFGIYRVVRDQHHLFSCYLPLFSLATLGLLYWTKNKLLSEKYRNIFLIAILAIQVIQVGQYHFKMKFSYYHAIEDMKSIIDQYPDETKILAGDITPLVAAELKIKAVNIIFRSETERDRFLKQRPNFLVLQDKKHLIRLKQKMPVYLANVQLLKSYRIFDNYKNNDNTYFYKINPTP